MNKGNEKRGDEKEEGKMLSQIGDDSGAVTESEPESNDKQFAGKGDPVSLMNNGAATNDNSRKNHSGLSETEQGEKKDKMVKEELREGVE